MDLPKRYISLNLDKEADESILRKWFSIVKNIGPSGNILLIQHPNDPMIKIALIKKYIDGKYSYIIPLATDLSEDETKDIVDEFVKQFPDLDFDVTITSSTEIKPDDTAKDIKLDNDKYLSLCQAWAKKQHQDWYKHRLDNGWIYGPVISLSKKTHPLMKTWDELPGEYKVIDLENPQKLVDLLNDQGFLVVSKNEVESLLKLMRLNPLN